MIVENLISCAPGNASGADQVGAWVTLALSVLGVVSGVNWTHHAVAVEEEEVVSADGASIA